MTDVTATPEDDEVTVVAAGASLVGQVRAANEDSFMVAERVVAVADGMGGHAAGEVASGIAVDTITDAGDLTSLEDVVNAVHNANREIFSRSLSDAKQRGMGTTLCVAALVDDNGPRQLAIANVGDSRIYLLADGALQQLTEDHSLVETLVREGRLTHAEASVHPQKNVLTRALGVDYEVLIDIWQLDARNGDRLLLCSDGLFNEVSDEGIRQLLSESATPAEAVSALTQAADAAGGRDNITAVVADIVIDREGSEPLGSRLKWIGATTGREGEPRTSPDDTATVPVIIGTPTTDGNTNIEGSDQAAVDELATVPATADATGGTTQIGDTDKRDDIDGKGAPDEPGDSTGSGNAKVIGDPNEPGNAGDVADEPDVSDSGSESDPATASDIDLGAARPSQSRDEAADLPEADDSVDGEAEEGDGTGVAETQSPRWRATAFVLALLLVLAAVVGVLVFYARDGWTVRATDGSIIMHSGRFESLPLIGDSRSEAIEGLREEDLSESIRRRISSGEHFGTKAEARRFIESLRSEQAPKDSDTTATTTTTPATTASTTTSTSAPSDPNTPAPPTAPAPTDPAAPPSSAPGTQPPGNQPG